MKAALYRVSVFLFLVYLPQLVHAQVRCGTVEYEQQRLLKNPKFKNTGFEDWMQSKLQTLRSLRSAGRAQEETYTIPVVVHILHRGEALGIGTNISDAQVQSQIDALNRDYPRQNADSVNTPDEFKPVAGKINITFVLAKQDPEGVPTNGITRTLAPRASYAPTDDSEFKALSYWPAEDYLNLWVLNLVDPVNHAIAYAKFPVSSGLVGLEEAEDNRLVDGVAVLYTVFGDNSDGGNFALNTHYNKGRTVTHEVGHIFGLRHIWGDVSNCSGTDYCTDTPTQDGSTFNCPTHPTVDCSHPKMFQNYMDYTDDQCYNLFTQDQVARMKVVLANSPRRLSLLSSKGALDPSVPVLDLGARTVINPETTACKGVPVVPVLQVRNYGGTKVTTAKISLYVNSSLIETKDFSLNLVYTDTANVTFSAITLNTLSTVVFQINSVNGSADNVSSNNTISVVVQLPASGTIPSIQPFTATPADWTIVNPDGDVTWTLKSAPASSSTNKAMYLNFYNYDTRNQSDRLNSPVYDLSGLDVATLKFDRSYALYNSTYPDQLRIFVSTSCDSKNAVEIFNAAGAALATVAPQTTPFTPKTATDWKTESISLNAFIGQPNVQISFVGTNQNGNNLYVDNVSLTSGTYADLAILDLQTPQPVSCDPAPVASVRVANYGSVPIIGFKIASVVNGNTAVTDNFPATTLAVGQDIVVPLTAWSLAEGDNTVKITISDEQADIAPANNILTIQTVVSTTETRIPLREDFNSTFSDWSLVSPTGDLNWKASATTTKVNSMFYKAFSNTALGSTAWLATPVLDLYGQTASVFFDLSYRHSSRGDDRLRVLASEDCGKTYPTVLYDKEGSALDYKSFPTDLNSEWKPQADNEWKREYINLDGLAGKKNVRLAWVVTNANGNNLYVDNIEFYVSDNPSPPAVDAGYSVYNGMTTNVHVSFNLPEPEDVRIQVLTTLGQVLIDSEHTQVLNQTYTLDLAGAAPGVYLVRLLMGKDLGTAKVIIAK